MVISAQCLSISHVTRQQHSKGSRSVVDVQRSNGEIMDTSQPRPLMSTFTNLKSAGLKDQSPVIKRMFTWLGRGGVGDKWNRGH